MFIVEHLITSFIASAAFGIIFNVPKRALPQCGFVGMVGWLIYIALVNYFSVDMLLATLVAAVFIAIISQTFAKFYKTPIIVFNVSGIIPLVPGGMAYDAMRHIVENDYSTAVQLATKAFMVSGSIAIGLVFSEVINQMIKRSKI
ncbi:hypothetical protein M670_01999 [Schinkia azotoformans MEV2011]|uniref:Threonine/Serine exporter ThrE domain-containing protein n=1 Tax=Schinkia azotoformans MEV2011 TaxID=1348973 RepID=A0A072NZW5_SCHAZ|nr:threonine/serine exporter family protein [Schinkia azotoformans]KEF38785.1 hypothetical protein M670_01999 [Schinkia azotoformans MEV2011]MEC1697505.1 threonine/serine exporter family protein [Schinkia azotoformans]MEC1714393.1 threonine/serine exporter family protein [Schinkia azotoformans]MEC1723742.1 threonine/serine exporter family protein [Schinkia azotoformans]MEC1741192.1 threonine/serine exporter family protein [Schinkia azotoformans]